MSTVFENVRALCTRVRAAAPDIATADHAARCRVLEKMASALVANTATVLKANEIDLANAEKNGVPTVMLDRLKLTEARIAAIAEGVRALIVLPDPLSGSETWSRPTGLQITRKSVPFGVIAMIFEARPNVTADAAAIAVKSGNAVVLRGGKEAIATNRAIVAVLQDALAACGISPNAIGLVTDATRESADALLAMRGLVDLLIPRGGKGLIRNCVDHAKVPVIETGAGNCHIYVDADADLEKALAVAVNAKCQRPSVCNAAESLLCHRAVAAKFLPAFFEATRSFDLAFRASPDAMPFLPNATPAIDEDFYTEYNDYVMSVLLVDSVEEAIEHINRTGTAHSEAIMTENDQTAVLSANIPAAAPIHMP